MKLTKKELEDLIYTYNWTESANELKKAEKKLNKIHSVVGTVDTSILFKDKETIEI